MGRLDALAAGFAEARNGPAGHLRARFSARLRALAAAQSGPIREAGTDRYRGWGHLFPIHVCLQASGAGAGALRGAFGRDHAAEGDSGRGGHTVHGLLGIFSVPRAAAGRGPAFGRAD